MESFQAASSKSPGRETASKAYMHFCLHRKRRYKVGCFLACISTLAAVPARAEIQVLKGDVLDEKNHPIAGAVCTLTSNRPGILPDQGISQTTDDKGAFEFPGLVPGGYDLACAAVGYEPVEQKDVEITEQPPPVLEIVLPPEVMVKEKIEVKAIARAITGQTNPPSLKLTQPMIKSLPLTQQKFKAALPLVPGVIRTPNGETNIKGAVETQGLLLVDMADTVDPATGSFSIDVPLDAIESLQVEKTAYETEYGRFSGGLTAIETKPPSPVWHYELNDFMPTPRIRSGQVVGIEDDEPRLYLTGPLWANHINFSEALTYDFSRQPVRGLAWPHNEIKEEGFNTFTSFQLIPSPSNLLSVNVQFFPLRHEFSNINSLLPQSASSNDGQGGVSLGATNRHLFSSGGVLTSLFQYTEFNSYAHGQGPADLLVTPDGYGGNYFDAWTRFSNEQQLLSVYKFPRKSWLGQHEWSVGADLVHRGYTGSDTSQPIQLLRTDGSLAEQINFSGPASLHAEDNEGAAFIEDHWAFNNHVAVDAGLRFSGQSLGEPAAISPRAGVVFSPGTSGRTVFRGGFGVFYDRVPLLAGDFVNNPERTITQFDTLGNPLGPPITFQNAYIKVLENGQQIVPSNHRLSSTPYNLTWNSEIDQELTPRLLVRLSYLGSRTYNIFVVDPLLEPGIQPTMLLSNSGRSRYSEFESTVRFRASEQTDLNVSYVWSSARGDLNTLSSIFVPFEQPVIRPDFFGDQPSNVPNRLITWARVHVPWRITLGPVLDLHSGFPYSNFDTLQNYVGTPNGQRFPTFFSLDTQISKDFHFPLIGWLKKRDFRGMFTVFNLTNSLNPRDVYSNVDSPLFGHFVGYQHRVYDLTFDVVY
jgi:carboxypeptidase family protein